MTGNELIVNACLQAILLSSRAFPREANRLARKFKRMSLIGNSLCAGGLDSS